MRYLLIILAILCVATIVTFFTILPEPQQESSDAVVTVNGKTLTRVELQNYKENSPLHDTNSEFLNKLITKQLLIAEAQRRNIDKEADFRKALKTFYEHSLIKILMERVNQDVDITVTDEEVEQFASAYGKTFIFYSLPINEPTDSETIKSKGTRHTELFDDLGAALQQTLAAMQINEMTETFMTSNEKIAVYLEGIQGESNATVEIDREAIKYKLTEEKLEEQLEIWMEELRKEASIIYHNNRE